MLNCKNGTVTAGGVTMEYIRFGTGPKNMIMFPGLGDGLRTMKGTALPMGLMYRLFAKDFTVWAFSRGNFLPEGYTTRDMARDQKLAMDALGIRKASVLGVSMGGMISQHLAADYPEAVEKLVLVVTCPRPNPVMTEAVTQWVDQAKRGDHTALMDSNLQKIYSEKYYRQNRWAIPLVGKLTKPKSYDRFLVQAQACLTHDAWDRLPEIQAPTLVLGGEKDQVLGAEPSRELVQRIPDAQLKMYESWGHGLYDEAKDFQQVVLDYIR